MSKDFEYAWKTKLDEERKRVLFFDRPFLPKTLPENELTEENVVLYLKKIKPQLRRADNRFWRLIDWVLYDLVFGGLVVLGSLGVPWGSYALAMWLFQVHFLFVPVSGPLLMFAFLSGLYWLMIVFVWLDSLMGNGTHPVEICWGFSKDLDGWLGG